VKRLGKNLFNTGMKFRVMGVHKKLGAPIFVELLDLKELGRLSCALERVPMLVFSFPSKVGLRLAVHVDTYFNSPVFYYASSDKSGHFLEYRNSAGLEEVRISNTPSFIIYTPIVSVHKLSKDFEQNEGRKLEKIPSIQVADLVSLAKVAAYRMLFEESPLPIFAYRVDGEWVAGVFTRLDEFDETSLFFYCWLDKEPSGRFIRYSTNSSELSYTDRLEEHGYVYLKVIKLKAPHPMVSL
jgi:hypothetical protein